MDYNKDVDDNFDNFYFINGQVVSLAIYGLCRITNIFDKKSSKLPFENNVDQFIK